MKSIYDRRNLEKHEDLSACMLRKLPEEFIREFDDHVNWAGISMHQKLSEEFIREFQDKVVWEDISKYQKLSEEFIREFQDKVVWNDISKYQKLSEEFIQEFDDRVNWTMISIYQKLSEEFIREFRYKIDQKRIRISKLKISFHEFIRIYCNKICIEGTKMYLKIWDRDTKISWNDFIEKYPNINDIRWVYLILYVD